MQWRLGLAVAGGTQAAGCVTLLKSELLDAWDFPLTGSSGLDLTEVAEERRKVYGENGMIAKKSSILEVSFHFPFPPSLPMLRREAIKRKDPPQLSFLKGAERVIGKG